MNRAFALLGILMALAMTGCGTISGLRNDRYSSHNGKGDSWLSDQTSPAKIDVTGNWNSRDWGKAFLSQQGRKIQGYLGDYSVNGVVSGSKAYLILANGGWSYYSVILEMPSNNLLIGSYSKNMPFLLDASWDIRLDRVGF